MTSAAEKRKEAMALLEDGVMRVTTEEGWRAWLDTQSKFHHYSANNAMLIALQNEHASQVAGKVKWETMGRTVKDGERPISILAPTFRVSERERADGSTEKVETLAGFRMVGVYDVSQTEGDDLPTVVHLLTGEDDDGLFGKLVEVADGIGYSVSVEPVSGAANGWCRYSDRYIAVEESNEPAQRVKTLAHEIGHALMHEDCDRQRALREVEAESVAYVVCHALGSVTAGYSFGYVAAWAGGGAEAVKAVKGSASRIQKAARKVIEAVEAQAA